LLQLEIVDWLLRLLSLSIIEILAREAILFDGVDPVNAVSDVRIDFVDLAALRLDAFRRRIVTAYQNSGCLVAGFKVSSATMHL